MVKLALPRGLDFTSRLHGKSQSSYLARVCFCVCFKFVQSNFHNAVIALGNQTQPAILSDAVILHVGENIRAIYVRQKQFSQNKLVFFISSKLFRKSRNNGIVFLATKTRPCRITRAATRYLLTIKNMKT